MLKYEIEIIKPEIIVTLGFSALKGLIPEIKSISEFRGKILNSKYGKIFSTFHPSYSMTSLKNKEIFQTVY